MSVKAGWVTPMLHVKAIEDSIAFYEKLGFDLIDDDGCKPLGWARMHCEGGALAFLHAEHEIEPLKQAVLFYLYTPDLTGLREQLVGAGVKVPEIKYPPYMTSGELCLKDPDGFIVCIGHWGEKEHSAWLEKLKSRKQGS